MSNNKQTNKKINHLQFCKPLFSPKVDNSMKCILCSKLIKIDFDGRMNYNVLTKHLMRVHQEYYNRLLKDSGYGVHAANHFASEQISKFRNELQKSLIPRAAMYSDIFKDRRGNYVLGLAISIIEEESLQRIFITLGVNQFTQRHTADEISQKTLDILCSSNIITDSTDVSTVFYASTTDSGSNMLASSRNLLDTSIPCFSHRLHVIVLKNLNIKYKEEDIRMNYNISGDENDEYNDNDNDDDDYSQDDDVSDNFISHSLTPARLINQTNILAKYMRRSHLGSLWKGKKMKRMVVTRWTSIFSSLLTHYEFITQGKYDFLKKHKDMIKSDEFLWGNLLGDEQNDRGLFLQLLTVLYPLHILANQLQKKDLTPAEGILHIFTCVSALRDSIFTLYGSEVTIPANMLNPDISSLAISIGDDLENYYRITGENISSIVKLSVILSPYERNSLAKGMEMRSEDMEKVVDTVFKTFNADAIEIYKKLHANDTEQSENDKEGNDKFAPPRKKAKKDINEITKQFREQLHKFYRNSLWSDDEENSNVFSTDQFWKMNKGNYNILFHMFLRTKAINPSNASIEGFFSSISRSLTSSKYNMNNHTLDAIMKVKPCNQSEAIKNLPSVANGIAEDKTSEEDDLISTV